jgi:2'-5' RNA ligase
MSFTDEGRKKGQKKRNENNIGWPEVKKERFSKRMEELNRRFDEPGMEIKERDYNKHLYLLRKGYCNAEKRTVSGRKNL